MPENNSRGLAGFIEDVMRKRRKPGIWYPVFKGAEIIYSLLTKIRNLLYDSGVLRAEKSGCILISIGNLTVGGTGKTPFTELLARRLAKKGVGILSRGYGSQSKDEIQVVCDGDNLGPAPPESADEPYMLALNLSNVPVVIAPKRVMGARYMVERLAVKTILLDDGFQTRYLDRDLDIVLVDAINPFGSGLLSPMGILRESPRSLTRADLIVITNSEKVDELKLSSLKSRLSSLSSAPLIITKGILDGFHDMDGHAIDITGESVFAFCGIANPDYFEQTLKSQSLELRGFIEFGDHHRFTSSDISQLKDKAIEVGAKILITTEKDAARLIEINKGLELDLVIAGWRAEIIEGDELLSALIANIQSDF